MKRILIQMPGRPVRVLAVLFAAILAAAPGLARPAYAEDGQGRQAMAPDARDAATLPVAPDAALAQRLFGLETLPVLRRIEGAVPGWEVSTGAGVVGHIASTWEIAASVGYSGRPLDVLVAVETRGRIAGALIMHHDEPILTLGLSDADIARFVGGFAGYDLAADPSTVSDPDMPDIISRATVTTGVIRDAILRTARMLAIARGILPGGGIDRVSYAPFDWPALEKQGAIRRHLITLDEARARLAGAKVPVPAGKGAFIELFVALIDPPGIGRNILGQQQYSRIMAELVPGGAALFVGSRGLYSHRGTNWRRTGVFDRLAVVQGEHRITLSERNYRRIDKLAADRAPEMKERSVFYLPGEGFDPTRPFALELIVSRAGQDGEPVSFTERIDYALPSRYITEPPAAEAPLWRARWQQKRLEVISVLAMLATLSLILLFQESVVRRPALWMRLRLGYLAVTLVWLGWILGGQLSVVQVAAFLNALLTGFRWETFLIEPVIFTLWAFVGLGLLFWGRGVFCGWLCPFGALQELSNIAARRLGVPQIAVPFAVHERLWVFKYTAFVAIVAVSFYSMQDALLLAEIEPFKTAVSLRMMRAWPFVLFVVALLAAGLFIERFYCRYLCPLGAGLAIPAKLKIFDWLHRRPQCGRECRLCETRCTVGAIDPLGRINANECVLCLRCQVIMHDPGTCPVLKRRQRAAAAPPVRTPPGAGAGS